MRSLFKIAALFLSMASSADALAQCQDMLDCHLQGDERGVRLHAQDAGEAEVMEYQMYYAGLGHLELNGQPCGAIIKISIAPEAFGDTKSGAVDIRQQSWRAQPFRSERHVHEGGEELDVPPQVWKDFSTGMQNSWRLTQPQQEICTQGLDGAVYRISQSADVTVYLRPSDTLQGFDQAEFIRFKLPSFMLEGMFDPYAQPDQLDHIMVQTYHITETVGYEFDEVTKVYQTVNKPTDITITITAAY